MVIELNNYAGRNNEQLDTSTARVINGGSWKRQRVISLIPELALLPSKVHIYQCCLIYPPNQPAHRMLAQGANLGEAYSNALELILSHPELSQWEYVLTTEPDRGPPPDGLLNLIKRMEEHPELSAIGGLCWTTGEAGIPQIWGNPYNPVVNYTPQPAQVGQLIECCAVGVGFTLWRLSMFKDQRLKKPFFKVIAGDGVSPPFWQDARCYGYRCAVDCSITVGVYDFKNDMWW